MYVFFEKIKETSALEQSRWPLWFPVLFGSGIGVYFLFSSEPPMWVSLLCFEVVLLLAWLWRFQPGKLMALTAAAVLVLGFINIQLKTVYLSRRVDLATEKTDYLKGRIVRVEYNIKGKPRLVLADVENFEEKKIRGLIKITMRGKKTDLKAGQCVEIVAKILPLPKPAIVGGYQFDRKAFYAGVAGNGYAISQVGAVDCDKADGWNEALNRRIDQLRAKIVARINTVLPPDEAGITAAIMAGERSGIRQRITNDYRDAGLAHFLSISGLHMSMLAGLMFFFIRLAVALIPPLATRYDAKKISAWAAIGISAFYLLISGAEIPSQRAFIMTLIVLIGVLMSRKAISMRTISLAALLVLIISPQALIGASFQMSFAAVVVLIAFYEKHAGRLQQFLRGDTRLKHNWMITVLKFMWVYMAGIVVSDLVASLATLPFAIYHFNRIAVYTTLGNFLAGPVIGLVIMPFMLLAMLLMPIGLDYLPLKLVGWGVEKVNEITHYVASLPGAGYQVLAMPLWGLLLIVFGGLWLCLWNLSWRKWGWAGIILGCLSILTAGTPDVMINEDAKLISVKDQQGKLVILPSRGNYFDKQIWLERTANKKLDAASYEKLKKIYKGKTTDKKWLDLECDENSCLYRDKIKYLKNKGLEIGGKTFAVQPSLGASFYLDSGRVKIKTIRDDIGCRIWNCKRSEERKE